MIAVDTNVVVRLLVADDPGQTRRAQALFASSDIFIPTTVLLETEWVLRGAYRLSFEAIGAALQKLIALPRVQTQDPTIVRHALDAYESGMDFADALHLAASHAARGFATFDKALRKQSAGKSYLRPTVEP